MRSLSDLNIESELSYAYLHTIASKAGMECALASRHSDDAGIDARVYARGDFGGPITDITIEVQLKATIRPQSLQTQGYSYPLELKNYDSLRAETQCQRILIVLFLPNDKEHWIEQTPERLSLQRCAFWTSLRGAPVSTNATNQTIYLPTQQVLSVKALEQIAITNSHEEWICHDTV